MKQHVFKAFCLSLIIASLFGGTLVFADERTVSLESVVVQSFDDPEKEPWFTIASKFSTAGYPKLTYVNTWPIQLFGYSPKNTALKVLGLATLFDRKEYNWVDLIPGKKSGEGDKTTYAPVELPLPGRVRMLDLWIWSGNLDYYIEAYVRDYTGIVHIVPLGPLTHVGWKQFRANMPQNIPQAKKYLPAKESLTLVKFRIWTKPTEVSAVPTSADAPEYQKAIYFYFDQLKVLTDTYESLFDGDTLTDPAKVQETWGSDTQAKK